MESEIKRGDQSIFKCLFIFTNRLQIELSPLQIRTAFDASPYTRKFQYADGKKSRPT